MKLTPFSDLGYMINQTMFERNGRSGYVLKPAALRLKDKEAFAKRTKHFLDITVSASFKPYVLKTHMSNDIVGEKKVIYDTISKTSSKTSVTMHKRFKVK